MIIFRRSFLLSQRVRQFLLLKLVLMMDPEGFYGPLG
jgi:hypothetical protein